MINLVNLEGFTPLKQFFKTVLPISTPTHEAEFKSVLKLVNEIVGGSTTTKCSGSWLGETGLVEDKNESIEFYHNLDATQLKRIIKQISIYQLVTCETKVEIVFDNNMILVDQDEIKRLMEMIV